MQVIERSGPGDLAFSIYHFMIIFRAILLKGVGPAAFWSHLLASLIIGLVAMSLAIWLLGRRKWE